MYNLCAFYNESSLSSCVKGDRCTFAHLPFQYRQAAMDLKVAEIQSKKFHKCKCGKMCLGRECIKCYNKRQKKRSRSRTRSRSRSPSEEGEIR